MSYKYFENKKCEFYPCHKGVENFNCMFCYCPLYPLDCGGNYVLTNGIKDCSNCIVPHKAENYDYIINKLSQK
ncbi:MAG: metal-binding protein [Clostridia bacterium]|nr:metal-binding protein [Clostridia bacterium]